MKNKTVWIGVLILLVIGIISFNIIIFSSNIEDWIKDFNYKRIDKSFDFEILNASWSDYVLDFGGYKGELTPDKGDPINWDYYCNDNCRKRYINCKSGSIEKCDPVIPCETNEWYLLTNSSHDLVCYYNIDGVDVEGNKIILGEGKGLIKGLTKIRVDDFDLDPRKNHVINMCCVWHIYKNEEQICGSIILPAKCEKSGGYCGDYICNSKEETCKNCPSDCEVCEGDSEKYWYEACIIGDGDLIYNENRIILQSELIKKEHWHNDERVSMNCGLLDISIGDEIVFRKDAGSEGIIYSYDLGEDRVIQKWNSFWGSEWALNQKCVLLDPELSFNCTLLHLFKENGN